MSKCRNLEKHLPQLCAVHGEPLLDCAVGISVQITALTAANRVLSIAEVELKQDKRELEAKIAALEAEVARLQEAYGKLAPVAIRRRGEG